MKKRILLLITMMLFLTGCTCEYNLTLNNNIYSEEVILTGENYSEVDNFKKTWEIPIDKDIYNLGLDPSSDVSGQGDLYKYNLRGSNLIFTYDFTKNQFENATSISSCYDKLTISNYENSIVISTSQKVLCFDKYPPLTNIKVNVTIDKKVISNNADSVKGNTYTWNISRNNANNKSINLVLENDGYSDSGIISGDSNEINDDKNNGKNNDYTLYIFSLILLIVMLLAYYFFNKIKDKDDKMED